ncbi:MAG: hypothetical protein R3B47_19145 [Bacteroidia bacterium]
MRRLELPQQGDKLIGRICLKGPCNLGGSLFLHAPYTSICPNVLPPDSAENLFLSEPVHLELLRHNSGGGAVAAIPLGGVPPTISLDLRRRLSAD